LLIFEELEHTQLIL